MKKTIWDEDNQKGVPSAARGYTPRKELSAYIKQASQPDLRLSLLAIGGDHVVILGCGLACFLAWMSGSAWLCLLVWPVAMLFGGRAMRGLECLVHEASHYNLTRAKAVNDAVADLLCAWPVLSQVSNYRKSHMVHHRAFGHATDPDRIRFSALGIDKLDRTDPWRFTLGVGQRLLPYVPGWWWAIGVDGATIARFSMWHTAAFLAPASLILGWQQALVLWALTWAVPVFLALPILRFVAETAEHDYEEEDAETQVIFKTTWSNVGWIHHWIFHPHNDGFHAVHHLYPSVPHHALPRVHERLISEDCDFRDTALTRTTLTGAGAMMEYV